MKGRKYAGQPTRASSSFTSSREASRTCVASARDATGKRRRRPAKWMISPWSVVAFFGMRRLYPSHNLSAIAACHRSCCE
jgi:hypothetical protein